MWHTMHARTGKEVQWKATETQDRRGYRAPTAPGLVGLHAAELPVPVDETPRSDLPARPSRRSSALYATWSGQLGSTWELARASTRTRSEHHGRKPVTGHEPGHR